MIVEHVGRARRAKKKWGRSTLRQNLTPKLVLSQAGIQVARLVSLQEQRQREKGSRTSIRLLAALCYVHAPPARQAQVAVASCRDLSREGRRQ